ncbi:MAG: primosomal protein N' [Chloroflexi bacterium]|nr:primosomal protein N' [Chloroflexota bacterium]
MPPGPQPRNTNPETPTQKPETSSAGVGSYAEVAVRATGRTQQTYSYAVPPGLAISPGHLVWVPFGRQTRQGIVLGLTDRPAVATVKPIAELAAPEPLLDQASIDLARWIADHYLCSLFDALALLLPPGAERRIQTVVEPAAEPGADGELTVRQRKILDYLRIQRRATLDDLKPLIRRGATAVVEQLVRKGLVCRRVEPEPPRVKTKLVAVAELAMPAAEAAARVRELARPSPRAAALDRLAVAGSLPASLLPASTARALAGAGWATIESAGQQTIRLARPAAEAQAAADRWRGTARLLAAVEALAAGPLPVASVRQAAGVPAAGWARLLAAGIVQIRSVEVRRDPLAHRTVQPAQPPVLTGAQAALCREIGRAIAGRRHQVFLLHGVTGSGKTEVYLRSLADVVTGGRQAIVLVPEIALTPQTIDRFNSRFPGRVAVLHSRLGLGEQYDEWRRIAAGAVDVVVGSRGAVFAPVRRLGLIVVDEEHEWTYKQQEQAPRYHARDVAVKRAELAGAVAILGSATPDVVSFHRARQGDYALLELPERVPAAGQTPAPLPQVEVVDLRAELRAGNRSIFSRSLHQGVEGALAAGQQVILFLNRRGTASIVLCRDCGFVVRCRRCDVPLAYHGVENDLVCHLCNARAPVPEACPHCGSRRIRYLGVGTQKVVEEVAGQFPAARPIRWDRDATSSRHAHEEILDRFLAHEADVLVGTQMIAKGLDLPLVTVVGVVLADVGLHLPDFRAGERTFQLLTQVAGRAGRGRLSGRVVIQTYAPEHYAITAAGRHDYRAFYEQEIAFRRQWEQPPFADVVRLLYASSNRASCQSEADRVAALARAYVAREGLADVAVLGPAPAYVQRLRGRYRWQVILRGRRLAEVVRALGLHRGWAIDVDPVSLV